MRVGKSEPHTLSGAYAIDAVSAADKARFERHLARCETCAQEMASFREAAARLAAAMATTPPEAMKQRTLAAAAHTRQLPPITREPRPWRSALVGTPPIEGGAGDRSALTRLGRTWAKSLAAAVGAAALVVAVILGVTTPSTQHRLHEAQINNREVAAVLTAPDATMLTAAVAGGGTATIVMSGHEHALVFTATGLRALPAARNYELWLLRPTGDHPAGMLPASTRGTTGPVIASGVKAGDRLGLTEEPAHGSAKPTLPMMLELTL